MSSVLLIIGPPGGGKSTALRWLSSMLQAERVPHSVLETESFGQGWPLLRTSEWVDQLRSVVSLQMEAGRDLFLLTATAEAQADLDLIVDCLSEPVVVCLTPSAEVAAQRVADREPDSWPGRQRLVALARVLATAAPTFAGVDLVIRTDERPPDAVASNLRALLR
ncbi:MAG: AAA family ATPase [Solirubrobacterales bacterium]|nr:AAA family ATPase [Solirubrobacterales bacterium]